MVLKVLFNSLFVVLWLHYSRWKCFSFN